MFVNIASFDKMPMLFASFVLNVASCRTVPGLFVLLQRQRSLDFPARPRFPPQKVS